MICYEEMGIDWEGYGSGGGGMWRVVFEGGFFAGGLRFGFVDVDWFRE